MGTREIKVGMRGMKVEMLGIRGVREIKVGIRGMGVERRGIRVGCGESGWECGESG